MDSRSVAAMTASTARTPSFSLAFHQGTASTPGSAGRIERAAFEGFRSVVGPRGCRTSLGSASGVLRIVPLGKAFGEGCCLLEVVHQRIDDSQLVEACLTHLMRDQLAHY